jgi:uncharacterized iron-regulated membrane protein
VRITLLPDDERRRSRRVAMQCPLTLKWRESVHRARTAVINDHGALVLAPFAAPRGTVLEVENPSGQTARARVVWGWFGDAREDSRFRLGLEFLETLPGFWGAEYERISRAPRRFEGAEAGSPEGDRES